MAKRVILKDGRMQLRIKPVGERKEMFIHVEASEWEELMTEVEDERSRKHRSENR